MCRINVTKLPTELLTQVADSLSSVTDLLNFRLTISSFANAGAEALSNRCRCIYLHPSPAALTRFEDICNDQRFSKKISKLVLLGPSESRFRCPGDTRDPARAPFIRLTNRSWPHFYTATHTPARGQSDTMRLQKESHTMFDTAHHPLVQLIDRLPQLSTVCYNFRAEEPGFNQVSQVIVSAWAQANRYQSNSFGGPGQPPVRYAGYTVRWSDAEMFVGPLASIKCPITSVDLPLALPLALYVKSDLIPNHVGGFRNWAFGLVVKNVTSLSLTIDDVSYSYSDICCSTVLGASPGLRELPVTILSPAYMKKGKVRPFLDTNGIAPLRKMEITSTSTKPFSLSSGRVIKSLERHRNTLEDVKIENVTVDDLSHKYHFKDAMLERIHALRALPRLCKASYRLRRVAGKGKYYEDEGRFNFSAVDALEEVAKDLRIAVHPDGYWDLGDYVMSSH